MEKIKIQKRAERFGKRKSYKKGDAVAISVLGVSPFISLIRNKSVDYTECYTMAFTKNGLPNIVNIQWIRLLTPSEKKLLGNREFAEVEFIEPKAVKPKEKPLPKKWCIEVTEENKQELEEWAGFAFDLDIGAFVYNNKTWDSESYVDETKQKITTDQFRTHVLTPTNKPKEENTDKKRIKELEKQVSNLNRINEILESDIKAEKTKIHKMERDNKDLQNRLDDVEEFYKSCAERCDKKQIRIIELEAEVNNLKDTIHHNNLHTLDLLKLNNL